MSKISQEQVDTINLKASDILKDLLRRIAESEDQDSETLQLVAEAYGALVALSILGYNVVDIAKDAASGAARLADYLEREQDDTTTSDSTD